MWLVEEMRRNLPLELDFVHEGKCAERVSRQLANLSWLKVGRIGEISKEIVTFFRSRASIGI